MHLPCLCDECSYTPICLLSFLLETLVRYHNNRVLLGNNVTKLGLLLSHGHPQKITYSLYYKDLQKDKIAKRCTVALAGMHKSVLRDQLSLEVHKCVRHSQLLNREWCAITETCTEDTCTKVL